MDCKVWYDEKERGTWVKFERRQAQFVSDADLREYPELSSTMLYYSLKWSSKPEAAGGK